MSEYVLVRIQAIQQELEELKKIVAHQLQSSRQKTNLKGLWKGIEVTEEDVESAQQAVFRDAYERQE